MVESITYLIAFAIVLVAFDKIINDIKKKQPPCTRCGDPQKLDLKA